MLILFFIIIPLPVIDELIARHQFLEICEKNSKVQIAVDTKGSTVYLIDTPAETIKGAVMNIRMQPWVFKDVKSQEEKISFNVFMRVAEYCQGSLVFP